MAVDHAQRARWASRVLRLRQAGLSFKLEDVVETGRGLKVDEELDTHVIGAGDQHPLGPLMRSFSDLGGDDKYVNALFDMSIDSLIEEWRNETSSAHDQMVANGDITQDEVNDTYASQDQDEEDYRDDAESMLDTGDWPVPHRLGHGYAMTQEADNG